MASVITTVKTPPVFCNLLRLSSRIKSTTTVRATTSSSILPSLASYGFSQAPTLEIKKKGRMVVTRAGPSTNSLVFAFVFPLSLLLVTIFTSIRIADKLDQDFLEELAINEAVMEVDGEDEDDDSTTWAGQKSELPRIRNRPKRKD